MISKKLEIALSEQINKEFYSAYIYLAMQAYFENLNLTGFANWMSVQVQEETAHAMGLFTYIHQRAGNVEFFAIDKPDFKWNSPLEVFEHVLKHEQYVTSLINGLLDIAEQEKDRAAFSFLSWYLDEQVEEEANAQAVIDKLKLASNDSNALLLLDKDMQTRVFVAPVIK